MDRRAFLGGVTAVGVSSAVPAAPRRHRMFVGTYSWGAGEAKTGNFGPPDMVSEGIYTFDFDAASGRAGAVALAARTPNPANLILHPNHRFLYAGSSRQPIADGQHRMTAFAITRDGRLREINHVLSGGGIPTQGAIDRAGRNIVTTNFDSDNIVCLPLGRDGAVRGVASVVGRAPGALPATDAPPTPRGAIAGGAREMSPARTRPHMALLSSDERFAIATQMSTDSCVVLRHDPARSTLTPHGEAHNRHGSGPRHIAWGRDGRFLYSADEESSTITAWRWTAATGQLEAMQQHTTLPRGWTQASRPAHVAVHPSGRFAYVNNRGHGSLAGFAIDPASGRVAPLGWTMLGAPVAWHFVFDPSGRWLIAANQSNSVTHIFSVNPHDGRLIDTGQRIVTPMPTSLALV